VPFTFFGRFEPFWAIGTCGKGQVGVKSLNRGGGLTLDDVGHLVRPPGCIFEERWSLSSWDRLLIAIVDACHMVLEHQVIALFGARRWNLCRFEGECWNKRFCGTNATQGTGIGSAGDAHGDASSHSLAVLALPLFGDSFLLWTLRIYSW
jgi:hypothetical protein